MSEEVPKTNREQAKQEELDAAARDLEEIQSLCPHDRGVTLAQIGRQPMPNVCSLCGKQLP